MAILSIGTTQVDDSTPAIVAAQALGYLKANTVMARLVARDWDNEVAEYGSSINIPYGGTLTANPKSAATEITLNRAADNAYTCTLNQHYEVSFLLEDIAKALARPDWFNTYAAQAVAVLAEKVDASITALYSGFSQTIDATGGLAARHILDARRLLNSAKAPMGNRYLVLHEDAEYEALNIEKIVNRDYAEALGRMAADSLVGRFGGFDIFLDQQIVATGGQCKNMAFHKNAICLVTRPLPQAPAGMGVVQSVMDEDGLGLRVTMSYDHDYLGAKFTVDMLWGVAELRDNHGVAISTDEDPVIS
jgi:hypothetical protein